MPIPHMPQISVRLSHQGKARGSNRLLLLFDLRPFLILVQGYSCLLKQGRFFGCVPHYRYFLFRARGTFLEAAHPCQIGTRSRP